MANVTCTQIEFVWMEFAFFHAYVMKGIIVIVEDATCAARHSIKMKRISRAVNNVLLGNIKINGGNQVVNPVLLDNMPRILILEVVRVAIHVEQENIELDADHQVPLMRVQHAILDNIKMIITMPGMSVVNRVVLENITTKMGKQLSKQIFKISIIHNNIY